MNTPTALTQTASTTQPVDDHAADTSVTEAALTEATTGDATTHETVGADESHAEAESGLAVFGINPLAIAFQLGVFIIIYVLVRKFFLKGIVKTLDDRHQTIVESLENAKQIEKSLQDTEVKQEEILSKARKAADGIIADANTQTGVMLKAAEEKATDKTEKMIEEAHSKIESDVASARKALEKDVKSLVAQATEAIIDVKLDDKKDADLIAKAIKDVK